MSCLTLPTATLNYSGRRKLREEPMRYLSLAFIVAIGIALPVLAEELPIRPDDTLTPALSVAPNLPMSAA